jgi:PAS domain S-box-containing protein
MPGESEHSLHPPVLRLNHSAPRAANDPALAVNLPIGIYRSTPGPKGKLLMANPTFLEMFGFKDEQELGEVCVSDLYADPGEREAFSENLLAHGSVAGVELWLRKRDGSLLWGSVTARLIQDGSTGQMAYFDCAIQDISEHKRVEEAFRQRAEQLALLHAISVEITAAHSLPALLDLIVSGATRLLKTPAGSLALFDVERKELRIRAQVGLPAESDGLALKLGEGAAGLVAQTGKPLVIDDYRAWPGRLRLGRTEASFCATLSVPLTWSGETHGALQVMDNFASRRFTENDLELFTLFANQAAVAVENARLREVEEKRVAQLESIRQASLSLTASLDLQAVLDAILESVFRLIPGVNNGHVYLYQSESGGRLTFGAARRSDGRCGEQVSTPRPNGLTYTVARSGEAILVEDMGDHPLFQDTPKEWEGSILGLPLKIGARIVGVMNISHTRSGAFSEADVSILRLLGDQAAIAIENARLFEQAATERRHLGLLYDMGRELAPSLDIDEILRRAVTLTTQALNGSAGKVFLYFPEQNRLSLRGVCGYPAEKIAELDEQLSSRPGVGLVGWAAQHRQAVYLPDVRQDERWLAVPGFDEGSCTALAAPILHRDRLFGAIELSSHQQEAFSNDHLDLLRAICQQIGLALSNVARYQEVQRLVELLAAEQHRLESLVERLPVGVLVLDTDYHLTVVNSLGRELLEFLAAGELGQRLSRLGPLSLEQLIAGHEDRLPAEISIPGPPLRVLEVQLRPLGGERSHWVLMLRDVTQERQNQARIQMQERLATVGQLAAGIAHDFNNIMAAILVYTDLLKRDLNEHPASRERLAVIQQQVQRAASLIRQILDFSRRSIMEQSVLDLLPFIKELDKLLGRILPETIQLELTYQPGRYLVNADPTRLQQVFMNMAVNARDAMSQGGTLRFELSHLCLEAEDLPPTPYPPAGDWVVVTVADTGAGIPADILPHIYEPFFTTKQAGQGTGLGLAQAYGIIKQHDGFVDVQSEVGVGTRFSIYLPALPSPQVEAAPELESPAAKGGGETILLVEDDEVTRNALKALLEAQNYQVLTAPNGVQALEAFECQPGQIDLIVSDVVMPVMGGVALYRKLLERWPQVKMLFVTGHPLDSESQSLLEEKKVYWLQKPFSVPDFSQALRFLLAS